MLKKLVRNKSLGFVAALIVILIIVGIVVPDQWTKLATRILIMALFATALNIQVGYAGLLPLGHAMFLGIGSYSYGVLFVKAGLPIGEALVLALLISIVLSAIIGYLCLRGDSMTFGLLNLAFNLLIYTLILKLMGLTGGETGTTGIARPGFVSSPMAFYFFVLVVVGICYLIIRRIMTSPFAKAAQGLRENEERLRFLGVNIRKFQVVIFVISGFFASVAGILLAMLDRGTFPSYLNLTMSAEGLMMCLIGGMLSFWGPSLGALIVIVISTVASNYITQWQGLLGVIIIVCVILFRGGILGKRRNVFAMFKKGPAKLTNEGNVK
jgi:branched-chain amino acid transport system permease protein